MAWIYYIILLFCGRWYILGLSLLDLFLLVFGLTCITLLWYDGDISFVWEWNQTKDYYYYNPITLPITLTTTTITTQEKEDNNYEFNKENNKLMVWWMTNINTYTKINTNCNIKKGCIDISLTTCTIFYCYDIMNTTCLY